MLNDAHETSEVSSHSLQEATQESVFFLGLCRGGKALLQKRLLSNCVPNGPAALPTFPLVSIIAPTKNARPRLAETSDGEAGD